METPLRVPHGEANQEHAAPERVMRVTDTEADMLAALRTLPPAQRAEWLALIAALAAAKIK